MLRLALPNLARGQKENVFRTATGASDNTIRPKNRPHEIERMIVVGEIVNRQKRIMHLTNVIGITRMKGDRAK